MFRDETVNVVWLSAPIIIIPSPSRVLTIKYLITMSKMIRLASQLPTVSYEN